MLNENELIRLRDDYQMLMPDTCNLLTVTRTSDGAGGFTDTWGTAQANVKCRLDAQSGYEGQAGAAVQPFYSYILTLPHATTITAAYRVEVGGTTYAVKSVDSGKSWSMFVTAKLERL